MSDPWDQDADYQEPWDADPDYDTVNPPASKSEAVARDLGWFDWRGSGELLLSAGSGMANEAVRGLAGIAGTAAGMVPGGDSPNEKANKWLEAIPDFTYQPRTEGGQLGVEMLGKGMEGVVEGVKYPASGYRGMAELALGILVDAKNKPPHVLVVHAGLGGICHGRYAHRETQGGGPQKRIQ